MFVYNIYNLYDNIKHYISVPRSPAITKSVRTGFKNIWSGHIILALTQDNLDLNHLAVINKVEQFEHSHCFLTE